MSLVAVATVLAAILFLATMICLRTGRADRADPLGAAYHLALLPAVALLPAPIWVQAAGYGWLLIDTAIGGASAAGLDPRIAHQLRSGAHLPMAVWVAGAGLSGPWWQSVVGLALAAVQVATTLFGPKALGRASFWTAAALNTGWMSAVAVNLA